MDSQSALWELEELFTYIDATGCERKIRSGEASGKAKTNDMCRRTQKQLWLECGILISPFSYTMYGLNVQQRIWTSCFVMYDECVARVDSTRLDVATNTLVANSQYDLGPGFLPSGKKVCSVWFLTIVRYSMFLFVSVYMYLNMYCSIHTHIYI